MRSCNKTYFFSFYLLVVVRFLRNTLKKEVVSDIPTTYSKITYC